MSPDDAVARHELLDDKDRSRIRRRAVRYVERVEASSGMQHLSAENRLRLGSLQGGLPIARIETEHEADEIASALHTEMPWMARATEEVWHGLRTCARDGLPGVRFNPLVLVGSPGIGKSYWARRLAHHLATPTTKIEATGEPANFSLIGSQQGWNNASPGKLMATVLRERHGGPLVIVDEIEKVGGVHSNGGTRMALTDALLPLLERMTAETWECPFFQVKFDMSWTNWVLTANGRSGLPEPLQSRCVVLDLPGLTAGELVNDAKRQGPSRDLTDPALSALEEVIDRAGSAGQKLSPGSGLIDFRLAS